MKKKSIILKSIAGVLLTAVVAVTLVSAGPVRASSFVIDDSIWGQYTTDSMTVYYWRKGTPPNEKNGTVYPVLICWGGSNNRSYYWVLNQKFFSNENERSDLNYTYNYPLITWDNLDEYSIVRDNARYPYKIYRNEWTLYDRPKEWSHYLPGQYQYYVQFGNDEDCLTSKLPFSLDVLEEQGRMISLEEINVPCFVGFGERDYDYDSDPSYVYAYGTKYMSTQLFGILIKTPSGIKNSRYKLTGDNKYAWFTSMYDIVLDEDNNLLWGGTRGYFVWHPEPVFTTTYKVDDEYREQYYNPDTQEFWCMLWEVERREQDYTDSAGHIFTAFAPGKYIIHNRTGMTLERVGSPDVSNYLDSFTAMMAGELYNHCSMGLRWLGNSIYTQGSWDFYWTRTFNGLDGGGQMHAPGSQRELFSIYYATPVTMDVINTSRVVEKGQVCNLDGPILINENCVITVKEGGTLTITAASEANGVDLGWVMNNGKIVVEKGGTLYIQKGACLNKYNTKNANGGGIICEGLVIVDEGAKLCGGGVDGLQFKDGSHVINYGAIISENFYIENDHTIENRGDKAIVFHGKGNGITGSGYGLFTGEVTSSGFPERGAVLETVSDNVDSIANAIYSR